jgi:hypothetical protein
MNSTWMRRVALAAALAVGATGCTEHFLLRTGIKTANPYAHAPNRTVDAIGTVFAYREHGLASGVLVILLHHLPAVLDNCDPHVVDGIATKHRVITFDMRRTM